MLYLGCLTKDYLIYVFNLVCRMFYGLLMLFFFLQTKISHYYLASFIFVCKSNYFITTIPKIYNYILLKYYTNIYFIMLQVTQIEVK